MINRISIVTKITGDQIAKAIRNLTPGTAPGPDGFQSEYLKMTLKVQNLEIGRDVITEIARYATAFGAGLLPVHTYYTTARVLLLAHPGDQSEIDGRRGSSPV